MNKEAARAVDCCDWCLFSLPLQFGLPRRIKTPRWNRKVDMEGGAISINRIELCDHFTLLSL